MTFSIARYFPRWDDYCKALLQDAQRWPHPAKLTLA